jgi:hypothetical protein
LFTSSYLVRSPRRKNIYGNFIFWNFFINISFSEMEFECLFVNSAKCHAHSNENFSILCYLTSQDFKASYNVKCLLTEWISLRRLFGVEIIAHNCLTNMAENFFLSSDWMVCKLCRSTWEDHQSETYKFALISSFKIHFKHPIV